jgi:hypothetical protein
MALQTIGPNDINTAYDFTINGLTVGKGGGSLANNTAIGYQALNGTNTGSGTNLAVGYQSLFTNTSGAYNTAVGGYATMYYNTTGSNNSALGLQALNTNTSGSNNTANGYQSLFSNTTASNNTAVGYQAGYSNTTGIRQVHIGYQAGYATTGSTNVFVGGLAGTAVTSGAGNTFIGDASGINVTTGSYNSILGAYNGNQGGLDIRTASNYIVLSDGNGNPRIYWDGNGIFYATANAGDVAGNIYNANATPYGLRIKFTTASPNSAGNYFQECRDGGNTLRYQLYSNGGIANYSSNNSNLSDAREKKNVELAGNYLDKVCAIPVKTFLFNDQTDTDLNLGVIAQDVQAVAPELVMESNWGTQEEPKMRLSIYQTDLQYALMKSIQELSAQVTTLQAQVTAQAARITALEAK